MAFWHTKQFRDHGFLGLMQGSAQRSVLKTLAEYMGHDGSLTMSQKTLAKESGESAASVNRALDQAEVLGLLHREREGRRKAERIVWHACPPNCDVKTHTGKTDTALPVIARESTADGFPKPPKKRRARKESPRDRVAFKAKPESSECYQTDNTQTVSESYQIDENPGVSFNLTTLKDKPRLNTERGTSESYQTDNTHAYALLAEAVETLARQNQRDALAAETEVLLELLNDPQTALTVAGLAADIWPLIPQPFTHLHSEQLNAYAADRENINTLRLYTAITAYNVDAPASKPWRALSQTFKRGYVDNITRKKTAEPAQVSPVAGNVKEEARKPFGQLYTPPPVDELYRKLEALRPAE